MVITLEKGKVLAREEYRILDDSHRRLWLSFPQWPRENLFAIRCRPEESLRATNLARARHECTHPWKDQLAVYLLDLKNRVRPKGSRPAARPRRVNIFRR